MILSDFSIRHYISRGLLEVDPFEESLIQPSSLDIRLGDKFKGFDLNSGYRVIDPLKPETQNYKSALVSEAWIEGITIESHEFLLSHTLEKLKIPSTLCAKVEGKSSLGRLGLLIHSTAGFIDPGFEGQITLELYNASPLPIILRPGMRIGQISFHELSTPADKPYGSEGLGSKYQGQSGVQESKYHLNQ